MITDRQVKARFSKKHLRNLWEQMLQTTSEHSKFPDHKVYRVKVSQELVDKFINSIWVEKVGDLNSYGQQQWLIHWTWDNGRRHWDCKQKFYLNMQKDKFVGRPEIDWKHALDNELKFHILDADCLTDNGTAISIYF